MPPDLISKIMKIKMLRIYPDLRGGVIPVCAGNDGSDGEGVAGLLTMFFRRVWWRAVRVSRVGFVTRRYNEENITNTA